MKKTGCFIFVIFVISVASLAVAGSPLAPRVEGNDVIVPDLIIRAIPDYQAGSKVYAACDENKWFTSAVSEEKKNATRMDKTSSGWIAHGMKGKRFHPVQLDENGQPKWAKIEKIYPALNRRFIDTSGLGPCLKVKVK